MDTTALKVRIGFLENVSHPVAEPGAVCLIITGAGIKAFLLCVKAALDKQPDRPTWNLLIASQHSGRCSLYDLPVPRRKMGCWSVTSLTREEGS